MRRKLVVFIMIWFCFILQCTVFQWFALGGIVPNLLLVLTASFGFMRGKKEGLIIGFLSGLLIDVFYSDLLCFYALVYMYMGYVNGFFKKLFYPEDVKLPLILITCSDLLQGIIIYVFMFLLRVRLNFTYYLVRVILPEMVYTVFVTLFLYRVILFINVKLEGREKRSASKFV